MENIDIGQLRDLSREAVQPQTSEKIHYLVAPEGSTLISLKDQQYPHGLPPERIVANLKMQDATSFCSYVNSFKDGRTRIFADTTIGALGFLALLDYHPVSAGDVTAPQFLSHRAAFALLHSEEWKLWFGQNDKLIPQAEFAEFIEDNRADIVDPDSASLLETARELQSHSEVNFASKIDLRSGAAVLSYDEQIKATVQTGQIELPRQFTIGIPVFFGEASIEIKAQLRFRIADGKLKFQYKLYRPVEVVSKAFETARRGIAAATTLEVWLGTL